jgi:ABC-2 type transport system ATP-binding protein
MKVVECVDIHKSFERGKDVLHGVSFSIGTGEVVGLLGKNGAGKTTLMRIAMGLIEARQGRVSIFGLDPRKDPIAVKSRVGYVSEEQILPDFLTVDEVISLHRTLFSNWDRKLEKEMRMGFAIPGRERIRALSKGQARQVALLCALAHRPELLLLDEPAGGLDPAARREFLETAIRLLGESGTTILFSSHYMQDVERLANRVVLIDEGGILVDSSLDDLRERHSLVLVPLDAGVPIGEIRGLEDCLAARERSDAVHAVFHRPSMEVRTLIEKRLGVMDARYESVPLEEMFIELVGGRS